MQYENFSKPKGLALIINNKKFDNDILPERKGTDIDAINIGTLFDKLDYTVKIKENLKSTVKLVFYAGSVNYAEFCSFRR